MPRAKASKTVDGRLAVSNLGVAFISICALELAIGGALIGALSVAGIWNDWADIASEFLPVGLGLSLLAGVALLPYRHAVEHGRPVLILAISGACVNFMLIAPEWVAIALSIGGGSMSKPDITVMTFNMWQKNLTPDQAEGVIERTNADVVTAQEIDRLPPNDLRRLESYYPYHVVCRRIRCDLEIFSRLPLVNAGEVSPSLANGHLAILWAGTTTGSGAPLMLVTTHYTWPFPPPWQRLERRTLVRTIARLPTAALILTGDFNQAPWSAAMREQDSSLRPLTRHTHGIPTFPAMIGPLNIRAPFPVLPLDQVYAGPYWRKVKTERLADGGSSHYAILASLGR